MKQNGDFAGDGKVNPARLKVLALSWRRGTDPGRARAAVES